MIEPNVLAAALLWLRNHYEVEGMDENMRARVLQVIDQVLDECYPTVSDMQQFREQFPRQVE